MTDLPSLILTILDGATRERPRSIAAIFQRLVDQGIYRTDRQIKDAILAIRRRNDVLIGSSKGKAHGYWIATPEEAEEAALSMWRQGVSQLTTARIMLGHLTPARRLEIEGQMTMRLEV